MMNGQQITHSHPQIHSGARVFVGTRVPVQALLDYLKAGDSLDEFLKDFPGVGRKQATRFLEQTSR